MTVLQRLDSVCRNDFLGMWLASVTCHPKTWLDQQKGSSRLAVQSADEGWIQL